MAAVAATVDTKTVKGVMLCDRPPQNNDDNVNYGTALDTTHKYKPFLPTSSNVANEQLGLTPAYKELPKREKRTDDAMSRHRRWLADEQSRLRSNRENDEYELQQKLQRKRQHAEFTAGLRAAILSNKPTSHMFGLQQEINPADEKASTKLNGSAAVPSISVSEKEEKSTPPPVDTMINGTNTNTEEEQEHDMLDFVTQAIVSAKEKENESQGGDLTLKKSGADGSDIKQRIIPASSRPKWAQTKQEAATLENEEADELIDFAANLDIDKYLDELGNKEEEGVQNIIEEAERMQKELEITLAEEEDEEKRKAKEIEWKRNFARVLNHLTNKDLLNSNIIDEDTLSIAGESATGGVTFNDRSNVGEKVKRPLEEREMNWDRSTIIDSESGNRTINDHTADTGKRVVAGDILRENPQLKSVHSVASVQAMMETGAKLNVIEEQENCEVPNTK